MDIAEFKSGKLVSQGSYRFFLPEKINHSFFWNDESINELLEKASLKLGELNSFSRLVPNSDMFIIMHVFKEAVVSSRIEGTNTNIEEAFKGEKDIEPEKRNDWSEIQNYVDALNFAIEDLKTLPISSRLLRNAHKNLMTSVRGMNKNPGMFRKSQNWVGGASLMDAVFVPPIQNEVSGLIEDLENFLNNENIKIPHLIRIAIAHYQFETIHPFLDGNGRVGRLLITLYLVSVGILHRPLLYLSDFFERNKTLYYDNLTFVRTKNDLAQWIKFFLVGVLETSEKAVYTLEKIIKLKQDIESKKIAKMGKRGPKALLLLHHLFQKPVVSIKDVQSLINLTPKASGDIVQKFLDHSILVEVTNNSRNRIFVFKEYIAMFS